jgi:Mrp family chromosome partitioning ATPase/capsular polysaccharide biosynthesis protein
MELRSYIRFLRGSWEWVALFTLAGLILAMGLALATTPRFVATSELFLTTPGYSSIGSLATNTTSPYQADIFSQERARSYVQLASRVDLARRVVDKLGISMRPEDLADATSASVEPDTVLIDIRVRSSSPTDAKVLADAVTEELANDIRKLETPAGVLIATVDPVVTEPAEVPKKPSEPNIALYLVFGASGGFLAGVSAVAWLRRRRAVDGPRVVSQLTGRPVLGTVGLDPVDPAGVANGGPSSLEPSVQQWRVVQRNVAFAMGDASDRVLAVTSANGSGQSSATAADLASAFAREGSRVVLVVPEPNVYNYVIRPDAPRHSNLRTREYLPVGLAGVIAGESSLTDAIQPAESDNLYYLAGPGPDNLTPMLQSERFREVVDELRASFDVVIFDSPQFLHQAESTLLSEVVDSIILVMTAKNINRSELLAAVRLIGNCHVRLLGSVWKSDSRGRSISAPDQTVIN